MSEQRIIFMGTPVFACGILQRWIDEGCNIVGVVSQPDKKVGRKQELQPTPIKQLAEKYRIPVLQPQRIKEAVSYTHLGENKARLILEYREAHQGFNTIEEIMNVKGIGEKTFEKMKDQLAL